MTTIAYDGKTLCVDGQVTSRGVRFGETTKLWRLKSGALLAAGGDIGLCYDIMRWLDGDADKPIPAADESAQLILIEPDGTAWEYSGVLIRRFPACVPWSGGTGEIIAMTAMRCGKTAREAVELAIEMDECSGAPVMCASIAPQDK